MLPFLTHFAHTPEATLALGHRLGATLRAGDAVFLSATLGVGKTVLARGVVEAVIGEAPPFAPVEVPSPTVALVLPD